MTVITITRTFAVTPEGDAQAMTPMTRDGSWAPARTKAERTRRNKALHRAFAGKYTPEQWANAQMMVHAGTCGYRKAVATVRSTRSA